MPARSNAGTSARRVRIASPGVARYTGIINGTWQAQWFEVSSPDGNGLQVGSTASISGATQDLSDGQWDYPQANSVLLNLNSTDGTTTKPASTYRNVFANSGNATGAGIVASYSVMQTKYASGRVVRGNSLKSGSTNARVI